MRSLVAIPYNQKLLECVTSYIGDSLLTINPLLLIWGSILGGGICHQLKRLKSSAKDQGGGGVGFAVLHLTIK